MATELRWCGSVEAGSDCVWRCVMARSGWSCFGDEDEGVRWCGCTKWADVTRETEKDSSWQRYSAEDEIWQTAKGVKRCARSKVGRWERRFGWWQQWCFVVGMAEWLAKFDRR